MAEIEGGDDLLKEPPGGVFLHPSPAGELGEELPTGGEFHDEVDLGFGGQDFMELENVGTVQAAHGNDFTDEPGLHGGICNGNKGGGYGFYGRRRGGQNNFKFPWAAKGNEDSSKGGGSVNSQVSKKGTYEKGESSGVIKSVVDDQSKGNKGKVIESGKKNTVINNSGDLELKLKEDKVKMNEDNNVLHDPNPFAALMDCDEEPWEIRKDRVDVFIKMHLKPPAEVFKVWDAEMLQYYADNFVDESEEVQDLEKKWVVQLYIDLKLCPPEDEFNKWDLEQQEWFTGEYAKRYPSMFMLDVDNGFKEGYFKNIYSTVQYYIDQRVMPPDEVYGKWSTEQKLRFSEDCMKWDGWNFECMGDVLENGHGEGPCKDCCR
ncbi:hypothetical protein L6452_28927 [Arctium lappa]|uniref:Uncharacterized protein n=1 Tax=Arctium lappa TaxID=4217 RepID=A0ACB8ZFQ1_ARCLA|nr:hypothetical protein L6452_28927 [Arctium lappa]